MPIVVEKLVWGTLDAEEARHAPRTQIRFGFRHDANVSSTSQSRWGTIDEKRVVRSVIWNIDASKGSAGSAWGFEGAATPRKIFRLQSHRQRRSTVSPP